MKPTVKLQTLAGGEQLYRLRGATMGTGFEATFVAGQTTNVDRIAENLQAAVDAVDRDMSNWKPDSALSRFNSAPPGEWFPVPHTLAFVIDEGLKLSRLSGGAFDMTLGELVEFWGFGPAGDEGGRDPRDGSTALANRNADRVIARLDPPALRKSAEFALDLSGIAKGFGVDQLAGVLEHAGIHNYLVSIDGEVRVKGRKGESEGDWLVAVEAPVAGSRTGWDILKPKDCALATSGDYRRVRQYQGRDYSHTMEGRSGRPVDNGVGSVTVAHELCLMADAWATALLVLGPHAGVELARNKGISALFLVRTGRQIREIMTGNFAAVIG